MSSLSAQELKKLRQARFGVAETTATDSKTTLDALAQLEEINKKKQERAARFGIETKEMAA